MKKIALIAALLIASSSAFATEVTLSGGRTSAGPDVIRLGVTQEVAGFGVTVADDRVRNGSVTNDTVSATVGHKLVSVGPVSVGVVAGGAFAQTQKLSGFGVVYGVQAKYALGKNVDLVVDARRFQGQSRIAAINTNTVAAGVAVKF